ncbi:MAG: DUF4097 family beta strand repeat-containing protein [Pyrinomonadaceae bacterium]
MSWLYSIVFASLFVSSDLQIEPQPTYNNIHTQAAAVRVVSDETEKFEQSYPISANGRVSVSNVNGSIEMIAWDRNEVRLEATKIGDSKESLDAVELKIDAQANSFSVETEYKSENWKNQRRKIEVHFKVSVPRTAVLNEIETVNGSVVAANFVNVTKISAVNGSVNASNLRGTADLSTVNGTVTADFDRVEQGSKIELSTVNGRVNLLLPSDTNATVKADSLNGNITNAFGLPVRKGEYVGRDLHGRLGTGEAQIKLDSVNGPLAINKKDDGKSVSPAVNLLSANRESYYSDADRMVSDNARRAHVDAGRAAADARRETARAMREANRELQKIKIPELENIKIDIDDEKIQESIREGLKIQEKVLAKMQDAMFFSETPMVERKTNSFTVDGTPKVVIDAPNCNVRVRGWDKSEVKYVLTEYQDLHAGNEARIKESQSKSVVNLNVIGGDPDRMNGQTPRLEVFVPRKSNLKVNTKGEIRLEGVSGEIDLSGSENSIDVRGSDGSLKVTNTMGVVRVVDFKGDLIAKTTDGEIYLDGNFDRIDASSNDGKFILTLPLGTDADIQAPKEQIVLDGMQATKTSDENVRLGKGGKTYKFSSPDGTVEVRSRESINAER